MDYQKSLPENAFRELREGEVYKPMMPAESTPREVNLWSVCWGILMAVVFSAAAAYLGLKVGQVFEAAIPITIIAVGVSSATRRKNALGENVMIQSIGACSGVIVAGAIGNIIDSAFYGMALGVGDPRFMYGSVVDMIYVRLFMLPEWFPGFGGEYFFPAIFNFADACVTVGIFAMIIFYKQFFKDEKKKEEPTSEETGSESSQPAEETPQQN